MIKYEEFKKRLEARGLTSSLIAIIMEELIEGIDIQVKNVELELQSGLFKIKNSNSSNNARCNYIIEKNDKELDFMKYVSNIKVSDFDVRRVEPPEITLTIIPFDFNTNKN
jgi:hypothetical protein